MTDTDPHGVRLSGPGDDPAYREVGGYRLVQELGRGGMGVVYLALNWHGRAVACKLLRPERLVEPEARHRLEREVATLRRVRHARVAAVLDADINGPEPFIVTEYVPGVTLDEVVEGEGRLGRDELVLLARGLAEALASVHAAGVVHRDLKPGNVMLVDSGPVIIDFGIAHLADDSRLTSTGLVMGTPGYVSPETIEGGAITPATDWWGWAVTLAYAASGEPPFGRGSMAEVLARVVAGRADLTGVDPLLAPLLGRALAADPGQRLSSGEVMAGIERYGRGEQPLRVQPTTARTVLPDPAAPYDPTPQGGLPRRAAAPTPVPGMLAVPATASPSYPIRPWVWHGDPRAQLPMRTGLIAAAAAAVTALAAVFPGVAVVLLLVWMWLARSVDASMTFLVLRRHQMGPRRHDVSLAWLLGPWHVVKGAVVGVLALIIPAFLGLMAAIVCALSLSWREDLSHGRWWGVPTAMALGVTAWATWWGLGGASLRRGTRTIARRGTETAAPRWVITALLALVALLFVAWCAGLSGQIATWAPLPAPPLQRWLGWLP